MVKWIKLQNFQLICTTGFDFTLKLYKPHTTTKSIYSNDVRYFVEFDIMLQSIHLPCVGLWNGIRWWFHGHPGGHNAAYLPANAPQRDIKPNLQLENST